MTANEFDEVVNRRRTNSIKWDNVKEDVLPFWVADMDFKSPFCVRKALSERVEHGVFGYTAEGQEYYHAIIDWMERRHHWHIKKDWICLSPGIVSGISMLINSLTNPGEKVILQTPVYFSFFPMIEKNGRRLIKNPLQFDGSRYRMDFDDLKEKIDSRVKLLVLCSPHNPVGRVWNREELMKLGEICLENNIILISDEIHGDLIYPGNKHIPYASLGEEFRDNCVVCTSPSKSFNFPGLQPGNVIISNPEIRASYRHTLQRNGIHHPGIFAMEAVKAAYREGEIWLEQLISYLEGNLDLLRNYIKDNIPEVKLIEPEGTYLVWLDFRELGLKEEELNKLLQEESGVSLMPGSSFGEEGRGFQRINIGCPRSQLKEGLERITFELSGM